MFLAWAVRALYYINIFKNELHSIQKSELFDSNRTQSKKKKINDQFLIKFFWSKPEISKAKIMLHSENNS